jgi:PAS domain S-box-containing protein
MKIVGITANESEPGSDASGQAGHDRDATSARPRPILGFYLKYQAAIGFVLVGLLLVGIAIVSYKGISQFVEDSRWDKHTYEVLAAIHELDMSLKDSESDARGYIITGESQFFESWQVSVDALNSKQQAIKTLTLDNSSQQQRLGQVGILIDQKLDLMRVQFRKEQGFEAAREAKLADEGRRLMIGIRSALAELEAEENRLLVIRMLKTDTNARFSNRLIISGTGLSLVLVVLAGWLVHRDFAGRASTQELHASETRFRGLLESAPDAMVIVDGKGQIELINAQAERMFGYEFKELHGKLIETIIPQRYGAGHVVKRDSYFAVPVVRGMGVGRELFGIRKDGTEFPVEISLSPLRTSDGLRVSSAIRDVTRQRQEAVVLIEINASLKGRTAQLEASNKELESFSYSVSHDLRTPLRSIDGFSQALLDDNTGNLSADSEDNLRRVRAASQKMGRLIDDLLNLARVTRSEFSRELVDLSRIAGAIIKELCGNEPDRTVDVVIAAGLCAEADPRLIQIMLFNLFTNAWKFTGKCAHPRIEFGCSLNQGAKEYFLRDNGAGFDMAHSAKLFGAFQRMHGVGEFPGTGIGLATVQRIVHRHGGRIWADAKVDTGATFHFTL